MSDNRIQTGGGAYVEITPTTTTDGKTKTNPDGSTDVTLTVGYENSDGVDSNVHSMPLEIPANMSLDDMMTELMALKSSLTEAAANSSKTAIKGDMKHSQLKTKEQYKSMLDNIKKAAEAARSRKKAGIWGWIGTIAATVAAVALCCTGVGAGVGTALLVGAALSLTNQILSSSGAYAKMDPKLAKALQIGFMVAEVVVAVVTFGASFMSSAAELAGDVAEAASDIAKISSLASGASSIEKGAYDIDAAVKQKEADDAQADADDDAAYIKKLQAFMADEQKTLQAMVQQIVDAMTTATDQLSKNNQHALKSIAALGAETSALTGGA